LKAIKFFDKPYFSLTDEEIYKLDLKTKIWLAKKAIQLFGIKDHERIDKIKTWYQIPGEINVL
jgi:hypothetical protein